MSPTTYFLIVLQIIISISPCVLAANDAVIIAMDVVVTIIIIVEIAVIFYGCNKYRKRFLGQNNNQPKVEQQPLPTATPKLSNTVYNQPPATNVQPTEIAQPAGEVSDRSLDVLPTRPIVGLKLRVFSPGADKNLDPIAFGFGEEILKDTEFSHPHQRMSYNVAEKFKSEALNKPLQGMVAGKMCQCNLNNYTTLPETTERTPTEYMNFMKTGLQDIIAEFKKLHDPPENALLKKNVLKLGKKDRYIDIPVIEKTVVYITEGKKKFYIHANKVEGFGHATQFICCQAPLQNTTTDFWTMMWQSQSVIIVQLARFKELNADKCYMYWPDAMGMSTKYGDVEVTNNGFFHKEETFVITELFVKKGDDSRVAYHCFYLRWPDRSVPKDPNSVVAFITAIKHLKSQVLSLGVTEPCHLGPPDIVHCSAGVGRSGTYCAIYISMDRLLQLGTINIQAVVNSLRMQRHSSVQEDTQYLFIYVAMLHYIIESHFVSNLDKTIWCCHSMIWTPTPLRHTSKLTPVEFDTPTFRCDSIVNDCCALCVESFSYVHKYRHLKLKE